MRSTASAYSSSVASRKLPSATLVPSSQIARTCSASSSDGIAASSRRSSSSCCGSRSSASSWVARDSVTRAVTRMDATPFITNASGPNVSETVKISDRRGATRGV